MWKAIGQSLYKFFTVTLPSWFKRACTSLYRWFTRTPLRPPQHRPELQQTLGNDMVYKIISWLPAHEILGMRQVCKAFKNLFDDQKQTLNPLLPALTSNALSKNIYESLLPGYFGDQRRAIYHTLRPLYTDNQQFMRRIKPLTPIQQEFWSAIRSQKIATVNRLMQFQFVEAIAKSTIITSVDLYKKRMQDFREEESLAYLNQHYEFINKLNGVTHWSHLAIDAYGDTAMRYAASLLRQDITETIYTHGMADDEYLLLSHQANVKLKADAIEAWLKLSYYHPPETIERTLQGASRHFYPYFPLQLTFALDFEPSSGTAIDLLKPEILPKVCQQIAIKKDMPAAYQLLMSCKQLVKMGKIDDIKLMNVFECLYKNAYSNYAFHVFRIVMSQVDFSNSVASDQVGKWYAQKCHEARWRDQKEMLILIRCYILFEFFHKRIPDAILRWNELIKGMRENYKFSIVPLPLQVDQAQCYMKKIKDYTKSVCQNPKRNNDLVFASFWFDKALPLIQQQTSQAELAHSRDLH